jgi:alkanesulfonate monooxygenase SsuD/methylene tetrahydromethanopterin reductase-like flavin-dependent oxidoreductase (luciferase family)
VERAVVANHRALVITGTPDQVAARIEELVAETGADEVLVSSMIHSHEERLRSYELLAAVCNA